MTQQLIADMLGVRREAITEAAGNLQKLGAIRYSRGNIAILSRRMRESLCCECYAVVRKETDRLLPIGTGGSSRWTTPAAKCPGVSAVPNRPGRQMSIGSFD